MFGPVCISEHVARLFSFKGRPQKLVLQMWMSSYQEMRLGEQQGLGLAVSSSELVAETGDNANRRRRTPFAITLHLGLAQFPLASSSRSQFYQLALLPVLAATVWTGMLWTYFWDYV
jgi:hypothetical protein